MLRFVERGRGPALVFLHAFPLDHTMWEAQIEFFARRFRVIAPDTWGFGVSQPPRPWTVRQMTQDLLSLLDALQVDKCALTGLSMGGYVALPFAAANPSRVHRLVLAHTRARADVDAERNGRIEMIAALEKDGLSALATRMLPRLLAPDAAEELRQFVRESIERTTVQAVIHAVTALRDREDQTAALPRLSCPTLVIAGESDAVVTTDECHAMAAAIPQGKVVVIPHAGHLSNLENPDAFVRALDGFLSA